MMGGSMKQHRGFVLATALVCGLVAATGCKRDAAKSEASGQIAQDAASSKQRTGLDRNACDLLTLEEVRSVAGVPVTAREMSSANGPPEPATETNRLRGRSDCHWLDSNGMPRLVVVGYWSHGKEGWQILAASRSMAKGMIQKQEDVALDSVVKVGPVFGLGDKAIFSPLFESLVLKDDILLEITTSLLPNPEAQFRPLVIKMLSRL
jgi:hypothetical protein